MPEIYKRHCDYCGKYYEGFGDRFCSHSCSAKARKDSIPLAVRFWGKVDIRDLLNCWNWTASIWRARWPYGMFKFEGRNTRAHRVAWILVYGPIPEGMNVLHRCDNPRCCNPSHLFLGTHADNVQDKIAKGRHSRGESNGMTRLSESDVLEIRRLCQEGASHKAIGDRFGVSRSTVSRIRNRHTWGWLRSRELSISTTPSSPANAVVNSLSTCSTSSS